MVKNRRFGSQADRKDKMERADRWERRWRCPDQRRPHVSAPERRPIPA